jgi:hypothetical protein
MDALIGELLRPLVARLSRAFPRTPRDWVNDAAVDALLQLAGTPDERLRQFRLVSQFAYMAARRNLQDLIRVDRRCRLRETFYAMEVARSSPHTFLPGSEDFRAIVRSAIAETSSPAERRAFLQWLTGDPTATIAETLGLAHLSKSQRALEVKRFRERILKRLRRRLRR